MGKERNSIFDDDEDMDLSSFKPKTGPDPDALPAEAIRAVSEASHFPSRQAAKPQPAVAIPEKRQPRRHRTGRTTQLNVRTTQATFDAFYAIADAQGWLVAETIEHALSALQRELAAKRGG